MKYLVIGDPHVKYDDLQDCEKLLTLIYTKAIEYKIQGIVFMGDMFHNHALVHVAVLNFWNKWLDKLSDFNICLIKGNHDYGLGDPELHSLIAFKNRPNVEVIDQPKIFGDTLFLPYFGPKRASEFYEATKNSTRFLFCHDTFNGAKFENGFYAPEGFDLDKIPQERVISGHIHTPQQIGKCMYVGSPRWQTISDANTDRFIYIFDEEFNELNRFSTVGVCRSLWVRDVYSEKDVKIVNIENSETRFNIYGKQKDVDKLSVLVKNLDKNLIVRPIVDDEEKVEVRESVGISKAYVEYAKVFAKNKGLDSNFVEYVEKKSIWTI